MHAVARLDPHQPIALVVQHIHGDGGGGVDHDLRRTALGALFLDRPQHLDRRALRAADMAEAAAMRAGDEAGLGQAGAQPLARHLQQAEMADLAHLDARPVVLQRLLQAALDHGVVLLRLHVDEVDDDQPGQVAQAQLAGHLVGGLQIGAQRGLLDTALAGRAAGVDVHRHQRLGLINDQVAAGFQLHRRRHHCVELGIDLIPREQRLAVRVAPQLHLLGVARHQHAHEVVRRAPAILAVHLDLVHVARIDVADRPLDQRGFLIDQSRRHRLHRMLANVVPQPHQVFAVPGDLRLRPLRAGGAHDQAHPLGNAKLGGDLLQAAAVGGGGDLAGNAAAARRVRHQHAEPAGERDIGGQRRALGAALFLDHLDQQDLPALDDLLDLVVAQEARRDPLLALVVAGIRGLLLLAAILVALERLPLSAVDGLGLIGPAFVRVGLRHRRRGGEGEFRLRLAGRRCQRLDRVGDALMLDSGRLRAGPVRRRLLAMARVVPGERGASGFGCGF